jgi:hypothetical protein
MATVMTFTLVVLTQPWQLLAQQALDCPVNGFCLSGSPTNLLGLPNGTLNIVGYEPWDFVVHPPKAGSPFAEVWGNAVSAWAPLEAEARATLSALHGVPNDFRLPHAAASEVRTQMLFRLIQIAKKKNDGCSSGRPKNGILVSPPSGATTGR